MNGEKQQLMPENSWSETDSSNDLDPITALLADWYDPEEEEEEFRSDFFQGMEGRRSKAAMLLMMIWGSVIAIHLLDWGHWIVWGITGLLIIQSLRLVFAKPQATPELLAEEALATAPTVSILVAAKNEEAVIGKLVRSLCNLDYPSDKYELWIIDDHSTDNTPALLETLAQEYAQLNVVHRPAGSTGGKSGALNQVLPLTKGEILAVFDADAKVPQDLLRRVAPLFENEKIGAVQVRKAIANADCNFWTKGQAVEMALDSYFQQQRIAMGGIGELRGNGQFARRTALKRCGGWNEGTITDDLDLTIRLHLDSWDIGFLQHPAVNEEGVEGAVALWHQRNRWAEGGYQRYLDYWRHLTKNRAGLGKTIDIFSFVVIQYLLPTAAIPDTLMAILLSHPPVLTPLSALLLSLSFWGMFTGLWRSQQEKLTLSSFFRLLFQSLRGMIYMLHWLLVMSATTARMSVRRKRLKWVKTVHSGTGEAFNS